MTDYRSLVQALTGAANQTVRSMPMLGVPAIMAKPIVEAGLAGLEWGGNAIREASKGNMVDPAPSLYHMANIYGLGGPASGLTSGGAKAAPFFSAAMRAAESAPLKTGANQQWLGWLKNQPGIKQEELDWMGVPEWLSSQPGPVTKQQVTDYIGQNKVDVQEVVKGYNPQHGLRPEEDARLQFLSDEFGRRDPTPEEMAEYNRLADREMGPDNSPPAGATKFSQYQLPGGENYRELLLTMPQQKVEGLLSKEEWKEFLALERKMELEDGLLSADMARMEELGARHYAANQQAQARDDASFTSSHYDEPNVLAHVRFNDRVDANGKKTLFLEEIQSDWHQKGRKQGYRGQGALSELPEGVKYYKPGEFEGVNNFAVVLPQGVSGRSVFYGASREAAEMDARRFISRQHEANPASHVPDAPFKQSRDWGELALKRMIKWAADNGYDSVSWTPGKVQAARYDLSKQIDSLRVEKGTDGTYSLDVVKPGRARVFHEPLATSIAADKLADHVGKELAEKIVADTAGHNPSKTYSGLDLQVGGEGMAGFYDKILPNVANKLGKKYGAKVGVTKISSSKKVGEQQGPNFEYQNVANEEEVWSLPITDAMRSQATKEGFPLFTGGKGGTLAGILNQALTGQKPEDSQSSLGDILSRSLTKGR
jgi:hypothetical protein